MQERLQLYKKKVAKAAAEKELRDSRRSLEVRRVRGRRVGTGRVSGAPAAAPRGSLRRLWWVGP